MINPKKQMKDEVMLVPVVFTYENNKVRTIRKENGGIWFVVKDVCTALGMPDNRKAIDYLDEDEKGVGKIHTPGGMQKMQIVSETGLYGLVLRSNRPNAREFQRWARNLIKSFKDNMLPEVPKKELTIRELAELWKNSAQMNIEQATTIIKQCDLIDEQERELIIQKKQIFIQERQLIIQEPKVDAYNQLMDAKNCISMRVAGKLLGIGQQHLFEFLRRIKILMSKGKDHNLPFQSYEKHFNVVMSMVHHGEKRVVATPTTYVRQEGVDFIRKKIINRIDMVVEIMGEKGKGWKKGFINNISEYERNREIVFKNTELFNKSKEIDFNNLKLLN